MSARQGAETSMVDAGLWGCVAMSAGLGAAAACAAAMPVFGCVLLLIGCLGMLRLARAMMGTWATLTAVFCLFHLLYSVSGPASVLSGGSLPWLYSTPYQATKYILCAGLATAGLALGSLLAQVTFGTEAVVRRPPAVRAISLVRVAIVGAFAASAMEAVNAVRAGGLATLVLGKADYQSAVSAVVLKLPSYEIALLSVALVALARALRSLGDESSSRRAEWSVLVGLLPLLLISLFLGRRGLLLGWVFAYALAASQYRAVRRISTGTIVTLGVVYFAMSFLYSNRAGLSAAAVTGDWSYAQRSIGDGARLAIALNPASNEFGSAFANFSEVIHRGAPPPEMGNTYLRALALPIPGWMFPGGKPLGTAFAFRDRYFAELRDQGAIAGTAYSSILEAYENFRTVGVFVMYILFGILLRGLETFKARHGSLAALLMYIYLIPVTTEFHRSDFSLAVAYVVFGVVFGCAIAVAAHMVDLFGSPAPLAVES